MTSPCAATAKANASPLGMPPTIRIAAPAPACVAAPAGAIGSEAEAAGERDASDGGCTARRGEGQGLRALLFGEEPLPAPRLEGVGEEKEDARRDDEDRVGAAQRPARMHEMEHRQGGRNERAGHED